MPMLGPKGVSPIHGPSLTGTKKKKAIKMPPKTKPHVDTPYGSNARPSQQSFKGF